MEAAEIVQDLFWKRQVGIKRAQHSARMGQMRYAKRISVGNLQRRGYLGDL